MNTFGNIKELVFALQREEKLITEMFSKRNSVPYKISYALEMVDFNQSRIDFLVERGVVRENEDFLELDIEYLDFFEKILEVNEEINIANVNESIHNVKENINYYLQVKTEKDKFSYLKKIKRTFRKIANVTIRSVIDLRRNIENTFKNEPDYKIKKAKLENFDDKRETLKGLIEQTYFFLNEEEQTFFSTAKDGELKVTINELKLNLREASHNIIEIEKQVIDFLNQIKHQGKLFVKLRKLKYLKEQFLIKNETNIEQVLNNEKAVIFEQRTTEPLKLSLPFLQSDGNVFELIKKVTKNFSNRKDFSQKVAENIPPEFLGNQVEEEIIINFDELRNSFRATSDNLFNFIQRYDFPQKVTFEERVTIFCQMVSQYEDELEIQDNFQSTNNVEYVIVYPK